MHQFGKKLLLLWLGHLLVVVTAAECMGAPCPPTQPDMLGPFYKADAPVRSSVGKGYVLQGTVRSSADCAAVTQAVIEFWLAGPDGQYDDAHRAKILADAVGTYRFESNVPPPYSGRPPHIHIRVSSSGFRTLVTQHYPLPGRQQDVFDLVLKKSLLQAACLRRGKHKLRRGRGMLEGFCRGNQTKVQ